MTHSLHRFGTEDSLKKDFCIYARAAKGVNRDDAVGGKLRKILDIFISENVVNYGSSHAGRSFSAGLDPKEYAKTLDNSYGIIASFDDKEAVKGVLKKAKIAKTGISLVVSGLIDEVVEIASSVGLKPHTASLSLGVYGKKEKLPEDDVLEVLTMCGHSLVSANLIRDVSDKVVTGELTPSEASIITSKACTCGIFNTNRCSEKFKKMIERCESNEAV